MQTSDQIPRHRRLRTAAIGLAIVVAASAVAYWRWIHFARPPAPELSGTFSRERLLVGERERSFGVYVPATLSKPTPLVVALHGSGETGAEFRWHTGYDFDRLADKHGFVVAYPDGFERHWDDCRAAATYTARRDHVDDVAFIHALIQRLHQTVGITDGVVFAVGHSNGAQMAYRLALELPDEITAVAAISAGLPAADNLDCRPRGAPISVLIMNGTADPLNPYEGGRMTIFGFGNRATFGRPPTRPATSSSSTICPQRRCWSSVWRAVTTRSGWSARPGALRDTSPSSSTRSTAAVTWFPSLGADIRGSSDGPCQASTGLQNLAFLRLAAGGGVNVKTPAFRFRFRHWSSLVRVKTLAEHDADQWQVV